MNTEENNKLIAEFMNVDPVDIDQAYEDYGELRYHTSWDWLMPVVEKIEEIEEIDVNIFLNGTVIFKWRTREDIVNNVANISFDKKIEHVYSAVVEFILWYNQQKLWKKLV